ncbi:MAG: limonene-1,2-epoxide hydrolase family protein [Planctomycetota bacterium]
MKNNERVVRDFLEAWSRLDHEELATYFTEDGVYQNMPLAPAVGRDDVKELIRSFTSTWTGTTWEVVHVVAAGDLVFVERVDRTRAVGKSVDLPCVGVFELQDGKIRYWRDYFDLDSYERAMG